MRSWEAGAGSASIRLSPGREQLTRTHRAGLLIQSVVEKNLFSFSLVHCMTYTRSCEAEGRREEREGKVSGELGRTLLHPPAHLVLNILLQAVDGMGLLGRFDEGVRPVDAMRRVEE